MDKILMYILIGLGLFFAVNLFLKIFLFYWKAGYDKRCEKREKARQEKNKWKYCHVTLDNPLLNQIIKSSHFIVFKGEPGAGKTMFMNLLTKFASDWRYFRIDKRKREYKYLNPQILVDENKMADNKQLPVYSELKVIDSNQFKNQELMPYLFQQKKAVQYPVFMIDEIGEIFGKELFYESHNNPLLDTLSGMFRYIRQDLGGWILATEQDGQNIFLGMRRIGYTTINCLKTVIKLPGIAKFKMKLFNILNLILPGIFTANVSRVMAYQLFKKDKIKSFFKLLIPSYWGNPTEYYTRKNEIKAKINKKYQIFMIGFQYGAGEYYIKFTHDDIYRYNTRAHKEKYDAQFDKDGNRKEYIIDAKDTESNETVNQEN